MDQPDARGFQKDGQALLNWGLTLTTKAPNHD